LGKGWGEREERKKTEVKTTKRKEHRQERRKMEIISFFSDALGKPPQKRERRERGRRK